MKRILFVFFVLAFFASADAQKKGGKKRAATKKTAVAKSKKKKKGAKEEEEKPAEAPAPVVAEVKKEEEIPMEPINSMSILNASSPAAFRHYRNLHQVKKGDSLISVKNTPVKYGYVEDKDVLRSMVVWEIIDMNERINRPYYHNQDGLVSSNKSLYQILLDGVNDGSIKEVYDDDMFTRRLNSEEIKNRTKHVKLSDAYIERINAGETISEEEKKQYIDVYETKSENGLGTGVIKDYIPNDSDAQLEESDRIKEQILEMENDMWNY